MPNVVRIALCGSLCLMVAMGIGRFALTPQLPLMLAERQLDLAQAAWVAAANYLGYLVGALDALATRRHGAGKLKTGLVLVVVLTVLSGLTGPWWWQAVLRFVLGVSSAWVLIMVSTWSATELARAGRPALSLAVFTGTGLGIALSGALAMVVRAMHGSAAGGWWVYGAFAAVLSVWAWPTLPARLERATLHRGGIPRQSGFRAILVAYGLAGFGYIIPATFLSQMAAKLLPQGLWSVAVWLVFGMAATLGLWGCMRASQWQSARARLALLLGIQALGVAAACVLPGLSGVLVLAILAGGAFMGIVALAIEAGREEAPDFSARIPALLTSVYALGQLAGPLVAGVSVKWTGQLVPALWASVAALVLASWLAAPPLRVRVLQSP